MSDDMSRSIAIEDRHLNVHENNVGFRMRIRFGFEEVVKGFSTVPYRVDREAKFLNSLQSDLLIDLTILLIQHHTAS